jgi:hypothetical protein
MKLNTPMRADWSTSSPVSFVTTAIVDVDYAFDPHINVVAQPTRIKRPLHIDAIIGWLTATETTSCVHGESYSSGRLPQLHNDGGT